MKVTERKEFRKEGNKFIEDTIVSKEWEAKDIQLSIEIAERERETIVNKLAEIDQRIEKLKSMRSS